MVLIRRKKKMSAEELEAERNEKELRKSGIQDEFQAKGFELVSWVQHHKKTITLGIGIFALVLVAFGSYSYFSSGVDLKAVAQFDAALKLYEAASSAKDEKAKKQEEAMKAFDAIAQSHNGGLGRMSDLFKGHLAVELGDGKTAVLAYKHFVDTATKGDPIRTVGLLGLASAYDLASDKKMALETYEAILNSDSKIDEAMVLWQATRLAKELGLEKKVEEFEKKRKSFKMSAFAGPLPDVSLKFE
jgi:hypothetical protein